MQHKLFSVFGALAATALAVGVSPAEADIIFGSLTPTPACGAVSGRGQRMRHQRDVHLRRRHGRRARLYRGTGRRRRKRRT